MSVKNLACLLALLASLVPGAAVAQNVPSCRFAHGGQGQVLSVAVRGSPGLLLAVDWGDGRSDAVQERLRPGRGRAFLTHHYDTPGTYLVLATAMNAEGRGCGAEFEVQIPFTAEVSASNRELLPDPNGPQSSDQVADAELGEPQSEIAIVRPPAEPSPLARVADAVAGLFAGVAGFLFGR